MQRRHAALMAIAAGVECQSADEPLDSEAELIVDALLGIGLKGPVHGVIATAIIKLIPVVYRLYALDIPSGLNADTGKLKIFVLKPMYVNIHST